MNVMYRFAWRQMLRQKRRTVITILGAIVAVAMITAVSSFKATFLDLFRRVEIESSGGWHAMITNTDPLDREQLSADPAIDAAFVVYTGEEEELSQQAGVFTRLQPISLNDTGREIMSVHLLSGAYPEKPGDVALTESFMKRAGLSLGDTLQTHPEPGETRTYTVTGVVSMTPLQGYASGTACALISWQESMGQASGDTVYLTFAHPDRGLYDWLQRTCESIPGTQEYTTNSSLLGALGVSSHDELTGALTAAEAVIMAIILVAAVTLIYNAFAISVTDRAAQFGMLASIGATKKQRLRAVLFEALVIGLIAVPFGLLFGYLGIAVTFRVVSSLLTGLLNPTAQAELRLVIDPKAAGLSVVLALCTVLLSAWIPALRAARVSPMEAIRRVQDVKLDGNAVRTRPILRRLFGFEGELAAKNLKRSRKRYRITTLSLAMSLILFLSAVAFTHYMTASLAMTQESIGFDLSLTIYQWSAGPDETIRYDTLDRIKRQALAIPYADFAGAFTRYDQDCSAYLPGESVSYPWTAQAKALLEGEEPRVYVEILSLDDEALRRYASRVGADAAALLDEAAPACILINGGNLYRDGHFSALRVLDARAGEHLPVFCDVQKRSSDGAVTQQFTDRLDLRLAAVTAEFPLDQAARFQVPTVTIVLSERTARALLPACRPYVQVLVQSSAPDLAEEALSDIEAAYHASLSGRDYEALRSSGEYVFLYIQNFDAARRSARQVITIVNIFVYGFIALLSLVGAANIVGTISTSLMLRKREFAMVKSVGMGPRAFDRMIRTESLFYGLKAVLLGTAGSLAAIAALWAALGRGFTLPFYLPFVPWLIGVAAIFLLVGVTMTYAVHKIRRDAIVEDLRLE